MKKCLCFLLVCLLLSGCGTKAVWETVADVLSDAGGSVPCAIILDLPEDTLQEAMASDAGTLYLCDGFTVTTQVLPGGDLDATLRQVTGYSREDLTVLETEKGRRYDCAWTAAGETGVQVGRTLVLSDEGYHYCVCVEAPEELAGALSDTWEALFSSVTLS